MDFAEVLDKVVELLQREQRVSYRALKLRFGIDDEYRWCCRSVVSSPKGLEKSSACQSASTHLEHYGLGSSV
jgi:hypothetical protein